MRYSRRSILIVLGVVALLAVGIAGGFASRNVTEKRQALATPNSTPVQSLTDCPWGDASCVLALGIERALQFGNVDAVVSFAEPAFYDCPGRPQEQPGEPFPLCEGRPEFTRFEGYPVALRSADDLVVDEAGLRNFIQAFIDRIEPEATDDIGSGALRLHAFGCPQRATPFLNVSCARLAIIFSAIVGDGSETRRELLVFWATGLFGGETLPVTEVWTGQILDEERVVLFESGGYLSDMGDVYVIDQSLRRAHE